MKKIKAQVFELVPFVLITGLIILIHFFAAVGAVPIDFSSCFGIMMNCLLNFFFVSAAPRILVPVNIHVGFDCCMRFTVGPAVVCMTPVPVPVITSGIECACVFFACYVFFYICLDCFPCAARVISRPTYLRNHSMESCCSRFGTKCS